MKSYFLTLHRYIKPLILCYALFVAIICFMPQPDLAHFEVPGIQRFGHFILLLRPFNTLFALKDLTSIWQVAWVIVQNLMNIFLLYPLVLGLVFLYPRYRSMASAAKLGLGLSLFIEVTQQMMNHLIAANRVFESDDLWTNTLGAVLAYLSYKGLKTYLRL